MTVPGTGILKYRDPGLVNPQLRYSALVAIWPLPATLPLYQGYLGHLLGY